jgi:hypothetical protein
MEPTLVTETSEEKTQTPGKFPEESTLVSQRGENLKTYMKLYKIVTLFCGLNTLTFSHLPHFVLLSVSSDLGYKKQLPGDGSLVARGTPIDCRGSEYLVSNAVCV